MHPELLGCLAVHVRVVDERAVGGRDAVAQPLQRELVDPALRLAHPDERRVDHDLEDLVDVGELRPPVRLPLADVVREERETQASIAQLAHVSDHPLVRMEVGEVRLAQRVELHAAAELRLDGAQELGLRKPASLELVERVVAAGLLGHPRHRLAQLLERDARLAAVRAERLDQPGGEDAPEVGDHRSDHAAAAGS